MNNTEGKADQQVLDWRGSIYRSFNHASTASFGFCGAFTPEEIKVDQRVGEFLIGYRLIWKHACARMAFPDCMCALFVSFQV